MSSGTFDRDRVDSYLDFGLALFHHERTSIDLKLDLVFVLCVLL